MVVRNAELRLASSSSSSGGGGTYASTARKKDPTYKSCRHGLGESFWDAANLHPSLTRGGGVVDGSMDE